MKLTEDLFSELIKELELSTKLPYGDMEIDYSTPFAKIKWEDALVDIAGVKKENLRDKDALLKFLKEKNIEVDQNLSVAKLQEEIFDEFIEKELINPTFLTHYPIDISPLARRNDEDENIADRFEFFVAGQEIANGFNELNDPLDQYERFAAQMKNKESGDDEAHEMDEDYIQALGYGLPPTAGEGIGIDRLVMLLTNQHSIRDVILFPAMKPIKKQEEIDNEEEK